MVLQSLWQHTEKFLCCVMECCHSNWQSVTSPFDGLLPSFLWMIVNDWCLWVCSALQDWIWMHKQQRADQTSTVFVGGWNHPCFFLLFVGDEMNPEVNNSVMINSIQIGSELKHKLFMLYSYLKKLCFGADFMLKFSFFRHLYYNKNNNDV